MTTDSTSARQPRFTWRDVVAFNVVLLTAAALAGGVTWGLVGSAELAAARPGSGAQPDEGRILVGGLALLATLPFTLWAVRGTFDRLERDHRWVADARLHALLVQPEPVTEPAAQLPHRAAAAAL
jgi:hypothetical protein